MGFKNLNSQLKENKNVEPLANAENFIESARGETEEENPSNKEGKKTSGFAGRTLARKKKMLLYLSDEEFNLINKMFPKLGMNKASLVRYCIIEKARELGFID